MALVELNEVNLDEIKRLLGSLKTPLKLMITRRALMVKVRASPALISIAVEDALLTVRPLKDNVNLTTRSAKLSLMLLLDPSQIDRDQLAH